MTMETENHVWLTIPGADNYQVCKENNPRVRNRKTKRILSANWQNQVRMCIRGNNNLKRSGDRCLYAAIKNVELTKIPHDVIIKYVNGEFEISDWYQKHKLRKIPANDVYPLDVKINHLDECIEFCMLQKRLLKDNRSDRLYSFLCLFKERVFSLCNNHLHKGELKLRSTGITFESAVANLIIRIKECKYITVHPTLALYEEVRKMYYKRNSRKENTLWQNLKI